MAASVLQWNVTGNENTVDHYVVYFSSDNHNLLELNKLPAGIHSMELSPYHLGTGSLYVQAVGKPSIKNQMSLPAIFPGARRTIG